MDGEIQQSPKESSVFMLSRPEKNHRFIQILALLLSAVLLVSCNPAAAPAENVTESAQMPQTASPAEPDTPPTVESYPFEVMLDDGTEITVSLPRDPDLYAEVHLCTMTGEETPVRVILLDIADDAKLLLDEARAFSGEDGTEYPVVSPDEILARYAVFTDSADAWRITVSGAEYLIPKAQFADADAKTLLALPDASVQQNFYVENGQLYCRVFFLCTDNSPDGGTETGFAAESLKIRYDLVDGTVTASEITFLRAADEEHED